MIFKIAPLEKGTPLLWAPALIINRINVTFAILMVSLFLISPTTTLALPKSESPQIQGLRIATQSKEANQGFKGEKAQLKMVLINAHGDQIERKLTSWTTETPKDGDKSLMTFQWPADVKGTKMLTWSHKAKDDDQWIFLPSLKRVKRISSRSKTGSFMGSEFSYEDLGSQEIEKYNYTFLRDETIKDRKTWVLQRISKNKKGGYARQILWMDKEYLNPILVEYYDRKNEILKVAEFIGYKKIEQWWRPSSIVMKNKQTKKESRLVWLQRTLNQSFSKRKFHKNSLKN